MINVCREKIQLHATKWCIELIIRSTCFRHYYAHRQELQTIQVITACGTWHFVKSWSCGLEWDCGLCVQVEGCSSTTVTLHPSTRTHGSQPHSRPHDQLL